MGGGENAEGAVPWLALLFEQNLILARDAEYVLELIFSVAAMWDKKTFIHLPYLACLAVKDYRIQRGDEHAHRDVAPQVYHNFFHSSLNGSELVMRYSQIVNMDYSALKEQYQSQNATGLYRFAMEEIEAEYASDDKFDQSEGIVLKSFVETYPERLSTVGKFIVNPDFAKGVLDTEGAK
jgi:hypothetical protein